MSFADAVRSCLSQYVGFSGRARRSEFWYFALFYVLVSIVAGILDGVLSTQAGSFGIIGWVVNLALLLPYLAVSIRRLHDTSRSGWWWLLGLIPLVGTIILIVWYCQDSHPDNQYGPNPKGAGAATQVPPQAPPQAPPATA